MGDISASF